MRKQLHTLFVVAMSALTLMAVAHPGSAARLPSAASEQGVLHAHTHGPDGTILDPQLPRTSSPYEVDTHPTWSASDWDRKTFATDQADLSSQPAFHAVYMYAADQQTRFNSFAAMFQADAAQASKRLSDEYGRGVRWDMRAGSCYGTPGQPCLDISSVKAKSKRSAFASNAFSTVQREMDRLFKNNTKKYVVWLDAPYTGACGQGHLYQDTRRTSANYNQGRTLAVIYRPYDDDAEGGFCRGRTLLHEMGHNMGAIQQVAPNAYDGAHCDDSVEDVMCYKNDVTPAGAGDTDFGTFDYNNDDYWDPAADPSSGSELTLPWWTVNLSKFICPAAAGCESPKDPTP